MFRTSFARLGALAAAVLLTSPLIAQQPLVAVWRTEGYGYLVRRSGDSLQTWEVTSVSCLPGFAAHRTGGSDGEPVFTLNDAPFTFTLRSGASAGEARMHIDGAASEMVLRRVDRVPERCGRQPDRSSAAVFDVFWETYRENYPFFADKGVDWNRVRETYAPRAAAANPQELFGILKEIVQSLHDAHTFLGAPDLRMRYSGSREDPNPVGDSGFARIREIVDTRYLRAAPRSFANHQIQFGMLPDSIAYLRINSFFGYVRGGDFASWRNALEAALDTVFADTRGWRGMVIDARVNGGGADPLGLQIASRLAAEPYTAYAKVARGDPDDPRKMTAPQPSLVRPSERPGWRGPVVELTSRYSVSAAETFTQALMGRRPAIARVGESTQGVFSDVLSRDLPNGWHFGLPNELFLTSDGKSFDGPGIPPTIAVPAFTKEDLAAGRDPGLERAIALLSGRR
jgi:hypothetical protein